MGSVLLHSNRRKTVKLAVVIIISQRIHLTTAVMVDEAWTKILADTLHPLPKYTSKFTFKQPHL